MQHDINCDTEKIQVHTSHNLSSVGEPADEPLNLSSECVPHTCGGSEGEPSTSTSIAPPDPPQEVHGPERRKRHAGDEDAYQKLLKMETERAFKQIEQANELIKLTQFHPHPLMQWLSNFSPFGGRKIFIPPTPTKL